MNRQVSATSGRSLSLPAWARTRGRRRPGHTAAGPLSARVRPPRSVRRRRRRRVTLGATLPRGPWRGGARAGMAGDRRRRTRRTGTPTARARLKHPGRRPGLAGRAARTGPAGEPYAPPASLPAPSPPVVPTPPYLPRARRSHSRPGTLSAAGTRPVQAVAAASASACTSRPRKRFPVPPPETDSASEGAPARERCAHAWLLLQARPRASAPRYPAPAQSSPVRVDQL